MKVSMGVGFPTDNVNPGHLFWHNVEQALYCYMGGPVKEVSSWGLVYGKLNFIDPNIAEWGEKQAGSVWYRKDIKAYFMWDGKKKMLFNNFIQNVPEMYKIYGIYSVFLSKINNTQKDIEIEISRISKAGFNTVFLGVNAGNNGVYWLNPLFDGLNKVSDTHSIQSFDAIQQYIDIAHSVGLKVHVWFQLSNGGSIRQDFCPVGTSKESYNHNIPGYREYVKLCISECLSRYPNFDGVHLAEFGIRGDVWGEGKANGPWVDAYYRDTQSNTYVEDYNIYRNTPGDVRVSRMKSWIQASVQQFLEEIVMSIKRISIVNSNQYLISMYDNGNYYDYTVGIQGQQWVNSGLLDFYVPNEYGDNLIPESIKRDIFGGMDQGGTPVTGLKDSNKGIVAINNYKDDLSRPLTGSEILTKLKTIYEINSSGIVVYFYAGDTVTWLTDDQIKIFSSWLV